MPTTTPNMGLKTPNTDETDYPTSISDSFTAVDSHDHSSGKGAQVVTGGLADVSVTAAKIANSTITVGKMAANSVDTTQLVALAVTAAKIANTTVTTSKLAALNLQQASNSGAVTITTSDTAISSQSISIVARPVRVELLAHPGGITAGGGFIQLSNGQIMTLRLKRGGSTILEWTMSMSGGTTFAIPCNLGTVDNPGAGSFTYAFTAQMNTGTATVSSVFCNIYEIG